MLALLLAALITAAPTTAPPVSVVEAQVTRSGAIIEVLMGVAPQLGVATPAYPVALNALPTFTLNGAPVAVRPIWSEKLFLQPSIAFQPYTSDDPPQPITIKPTDVVTWSAPDGWVKTSQGSAGAEVGTAVNYVGGWERVYYGYSPFTVKPRLGLGFNNTPFAQYQASVMKDISHRSSNPWFGAASSTVDGYPLTYSAGGLVWSVVFDAGSTNGIDAKQVASPVGMFTVVADEWNPTAPTIVALTTSPAQPGAITAPTMTPGVVLASGHEIGKRWTWTVGLGTNTYNLKLGVMLTAPLPHANGQPVTLKNLYVSCGDDAPDTVDRLACSDNFLRMITARPGVYSPYCRYLLGNDGATSQTRREHLRPATDFSYSSSARTIVVTSVQPYSLDVHPNVYTAQKYLRALPAGDGGFAFPVQTLGLNYDWMYPNRTDGACVLEFVTDTPHGLDSGQFVNFAAGFSVNVASPTGVKGVAKVQPGDQIPWVTSPTSFINVASSTLGVTTRMGLADGAQPVTASATVRTMPANMMPIEALTAPCRATNGKHGLYYTVNHSLNDEAVRAVAQRIYNSTPRGTKIRVQYSNEILIPNYQFGWMQTLATLEGLAQVQAVVQRTYEVHEIFADVFGDDAKSIVRLFQPFTMAPNQVGQAFTYAQAHSIPIDEMAISAYPEVDDHSPSLQMAAASLVADHPDSIAHPSQGGMGLMLSMDGYIDLARFAFKYRKDMNGPGSTVAGLYRAMVATGYGTGTGSGFVYPLPKIAGYEAGICTLIPAGVSRTTKVVRSGLTHDMMYHPRYGEVLYAYLQSLQQPGAAWATGFDNIAFVNLTQGRSFGGAYFVCPDGADNGFTQPWGVYMHQTQKAGAGLGNKFWKDDGAAHDHENESPLARAALDWIAACQ